MREPPLRFQMLGGVDLRRPDGSSANSVLVQPKRVALLAYVAVESTGGFVPRDRILSVIWPDSDESRARQSLRNALYQVRRSLTDDVLVNRGAAEVGVDPESLSVDVLDFRRAVARGRFSDAVDLYRGPFLNGFHLDENSEFEEWAAGVRATLHGDALWALREAATASEDAGDRDAARNLLRRAQTLAPGDEEILRRQLLLLMAQGNRAAALAEAREWTEMLASTLGVRPSEPTLRLIRELTGEDSSASGGVSLSESHPLPSTGSPALEPMKERAVAGPSPGEAATDPGEIPGQPGRDAIGRVSRGWLRGAAAAAVGVAMVGAAVSLLVDEPALLPPTDAGVIIERFEADDAAGGDAAGLALAVLTARLLEAGGGAGVIPPNGASATSEDHVARRLVSGSVRSDGHVFVADISLASTADPDDILVSATAEIDHFDLETLAVRLVDELAGRAGQSLASSVSVPPFTDVPGAVLPYFEGEIFARAGRRAEARGAYDRALSLDSTFAMASFRQAMLLQSLGLRDEALTFSDRAVAHSSSMTGPERRRLDAWRVYQWGNVEQALPMFEDLAKSRAPDPDVLLTLAEIRFHWGPQLGASRESADSAFRALLATTPDDVDALQHLVRLMGPVATPESIDEFVERIVDLGASDDVLMEARAISALSRRTPLDEEIADWVTDGAFNFESRRLTQLAASARAPWDLASFIRGLPSTEEPRRLILRRLLVAQLAAAAGRMQEAREELAVLAEQYPDRALEYRIALELSSPIRPEAELLRDLRRRLRALPDEPRPRHALMAEVDARGIYPPRTLVLDAMLTRRLGEPIDSASVMTRGQALPDPFAPEYRGHVLAEILAATGRHERILGLLGPGGPEWHRIRPDPLSYLAGMSRWARIRSLLALGDEGEALRWLRTFPDVGGYDLVFVAEASLLSGRILERYGRQAEAAAAYRRAAEIWDGADPEYDPLVNQVREGEERTAAGLRDRASDGA